MAFTFAPATARMRAAQRSSRPPARRAFRSEAVRRSWIVANICFVAFLALAFVGLSPFQDWSGDTVVTGQGDLTGQLLYVGLFLALLLGCGTLVTRRQMLPVPLAVTLLLGYCLLSVSWAVAPDIALRRLILVSIVIWVIFRCVGDLGYARSVTLLRYALIVLLALNYAVVFLTDSGVHDSALDEAALILGAWHGIMPHKNLAGAMCAFTVLFFLFDVRGFPKIVSGVVILLSLIFLYYTESKTSESILVLAVLSGFLIRPYNTRYRAGLAVGVLVAVIAGAFVLSENSVAIRDMLNDPAALTGRATIWPLLLEYAGKHLWTGAGFSAFWRSGDVSPIWTLTNGWVAHEASHGHNGYLDLLVTIGLPGLLLAMVVLLVSPLLRLFTSDALSPSQRALLGAVLLFCLGHNVTESSFLGGTSVVNAFLFLAIAMIYRLATDQVGRHPMLAALRLSPAQLRARRMSAMPRPGRAVARAPRHDTPA